MQRQRILFEPEPTTKPQFRRLTMMRFRTVLALAGSALLLAATVAAQNHIVIQRHSAGGPPHPPPPPPPPGAEDVVITAQAPTFEFISAEPAFMERTVTGAPYSAEAVTDTTRTLADGTRIKNTHNAKIFRDSEGRIRKEQAFGHLGFWVPEGGEPKTQITIVDPVAKKTILLDPEDRTARVLPVPSFVTIPDVPPVPPVPPVPGVPPAPSVAGVSPEHNVFFRAEPSEDIDTTTSPDGKTVTTRKIERHVEVIAGNKMATVGAGPVGSAAMVLPRTMIFHGVENADNVKVEELGEQTVQGVLAKGTRRTTTIPTGAIGNDRPIVSVTEEWISPELKVVVQRTVKDPQMGETSYRLENLNRAEPLKSLFEVPSGYEVKETAPKMQRIEIKRRSDGE
jgi:hypothetical protein